MTETLNKQAGSIGDALKEYWDKAAPYHPGILGAVGGAAFAGLGTMGRRANENPRQRALRIIRNAAAGGLLGGAGTQLLVPGAKTFFDATTGAKKESPKPGFVSSIPARLGYVGGTLGVGQVWKRKRLLKSLQDLLPSEGLGNVSYKLHPSEQTMAHAPAPGAVPLPGVGNRRLRGNAPFLGITDPTHIGLPETGDRLARTTDKILRHSAKENPRSFSRLLTEIRKKTLSGGSSTNPDLIPFIRSNYTRGPLHSLDRATNIFGSNARTPWGRGFGRAGSYGVLGLAATAPDWMNKMIESGGEKVEKGLVEQITDAFNPPPAKEETWYDELVKGRKLF